MAISDLILTYKASKKYILSYNVEGCRNVAHWLNVNEVPPLAATEQNYGPKKCMLCQTKRSSPLDDVGQMLLATAPLCAE